MHTLPEWFIGGGSIPCPGVSWRAINAAKVKEEKKMRQHYLGAVRANNPLALPDISIEYFERGKLWKRGPFIEEDCNNSGFYWACSRPGYLPDLGWIGPFETENEALQDAQQQ